MDGTEKVADPLPPKDFEGLQDRLAEIQAGLPKRLRQCADYVLREPDRVAFATVAEAATTAQVKPSAMIRFSKLLGFSGFTEMQRVFQARLSGSWPDYSTRLDTLRASGDDTPGRLLADFVDVSHASLDRLPVTLTEEGLRAAVSALAGAGCIHVIGLRRAFSVATYLAYALEKVGRPVVLHDRIGELDKTRLMNPGDALLAVSFAPYTPQTIALASLAVSKNLTAIAITDHRLSPLAEIAHNSLLVEERDFGAFRSLSATFCLATTLAVAVGAQRHEGDAEDP